jgi:hypothetical protein
VRMHFTCCRTLVLTLSRKTGKYTSNDGNAESFDTVILGDLMSLEGGSMTASIDPFDCKQPFRPLQEFISAAMEHVHAQVGLRFGKGQKFTTKDD